MADQAGLFELEPPSPRRFVGIAGFLAGMLATWLVDGKPTKAQKEYLLAEAAAFLDRVAEGVRAHG